MLHQTDNLLTVLYLRLSREDENEGDSNSIVNNLIDKGIISCFS